VSALEEYQLAKEMFNECVLSETADAAIAELEAERNDIAGLLNAADKQNHFLKAANEQAEAEVARLRKLFGMAERGTK
jgi:hypothetical protein